MVLILNCVKKTLTLFGWVCVFVFSKFGIHSFIVYHIRHEMHHEIRGLCGSKCSNHVRRKIDMRKKGSRNEIHRTHTHTHVMKRERKYSLSQKRAQERHRDERDRERETAKLDEQTSGKNKLFKASSWCLNLNVFRKWFTLLRIVCIRFSCFFPRCYYSSQTHEVESKEKIAWARAHTRAPFTALKAKQPKE